MSTPSLPTVAGLWQLAIAHAEALQPRILVFGEDPPDDSARDAPYLVIEPDPGWDQIARADGRVSSRRGRFTVRACGSTVAQATLALDGARDRFVDWRPYGDDLRWGMARETDADPLLPIRQGALIRWEFSLTYEVDD